MARSAIHPGEHLADAIAAVNITAAQLARDLQVPANRVTGILHGTRAITADTALRLGRYFGTSAEFWMNLQQLYDLRRAAQEIGPTLEQEIGVRNRGQSEIFQSKSPRGNTTRK